jgi:hypothetical protein
MALVDSEVRAGLEADRASGPRAREERWLREELGLRFDPFRHLDAGADPRLSAYLVDHGGFAKLWGDWSSFLFAPAGGGKTAFRVRLARACRVEQDGRRVLPVIFRLPRPEAPDIPPDEVGYLEKLSHEVGAALLLQLAYRPGRFLSLPSALRGEVRLALERGLAGSLDYYLSQLEDVGSLTPLAQAFDPTAVGLPAEPSAGRIALFCEALRETPFRNARALDPQEGLQQAVELLIDGLEYESIYLLVDGADAYIQEPAFAIRLLDPVLGRMEQWRQQSLYAKFFLPEELRPLLIENYQSLLTNGQKIATITWNVESLVGVIRERLRAASEGMYDSLEAISTRDVPGRIEERLAKAVHPSVPREIVHLTRRVFTQHVLRVGPYGRLEQKDFAAADRWYEGR